MKVVATETDEDPNVNEIEITSSNDMEQNNCKIDKLSTGSFAVQDF
jgi:hypothetical protein